MRNDPTRCQHTCRSGQCQNLAVEGHDRCAIHLGDPDYEAKKALRAYVLTNTDIAERAGRHTRVEELKSLREEIALCRSLVERRLDMIESNADFLAACGQVNTLFLTLEKLITSCHRLEVNLGSLLSKAAILDLAKEIVGILMDELEHIDGCEAIVDAVSERIIATIANQEKE
jgi:hypothetical protein